MTNTIYIHQPEKAVSFTRLPNFLFEAPTFTPLSNEAKVLYAFILRRTDLSRKTAGRTNTGGFTSTIPSTRWWSCFTADGRKRSAPCGSCNTPDWWRFRSRAVENPTAFIQNPMKRFQTPTSRNPVMERRRTEKLKSELDNMQRLVDRIPPEVLAELKRQQRHTKER